MLERFLRSVGVGDEMLAHLDKVTLQFQRPTLLLVCLFLLLPLTWYIYRRQKSNLPTANKAVRIVLTCTRVFILGLLFVILAGPYLRLEHQLEKRPLVGVLIDHSQSMRLPAGRYDDELTRRLLQASGVEVSEEGVPPTQRQLLETQPRSDLVHAVVNHFSGNFLAPLAERFETKLYRVAGEMRPFLADAKTGELSPPAETGGARTYLGDAVSEFVKEAAGREVAGIFLFTDGQNTGGESLAAASQEAVGAAAPVFPVAVGSDERFRDVAIVDTFTSGVVSVGDAAQVAVTIESQGFDEQSVQVQLFDGDVLLASKELVLLGREQQQINLSFTAESPGVHYLSARIPPQPEEPAFLHDNNSDLALLRVTDEKIRVLYVEGRPRWDFRFLKNALRRDHGIGGADEEEPTVVLETEARRLADEDAPLPKSKADLDVYDLVILGDVSQDLATPEFLEMVSAAVRDDGLGLIVAAGPEFMPHQHSATFQELLPVKLSQGQSGADAPAYKPFRLKLTAAGRIHETLRLFEDEQRNQTAWEEMPEFYWCGAVERASPGASILAVNEGLENRYGKVPVICYHYAGQGKVFFVGTDATWRWRRFVGDRYFYKFWGQAIRFTARRSEDDQKNRIEVRPFRATPGKPVQVEVFAFLSDRAPRQDREVPATAAFEDDVEHLSLRADPNTPGRYTGSYVPSKVGDYSFTYAPPDGDAVNARIRAVAAHEELRRPNVNRPALQLLANSTGGRLLELPDIVTVPSELKGEPKRQYLRQEATIWDNWLTLALLVLVYSLDVGLRRLTGLA